MPYLFYQFPVGLFTKQPEINIKHQELLTFHGRGRRGKISNNGKNYIWLRLLVLVILIGTATLIIYEFDLVRLFINRNRLQEFLESLGPWSAVAFVLLQALQVVAAPIPGEVTGFLGGYLYGPLLGIGLSTLGLTIGSYSAFALSRIFGRPFVDRFVSKSTMDRFDYLLHHKGAFLVFLLFLIPGFPKDYLCYVLGLGHLSTMEFLVIGGTGRLFGTVLLTMGGNYIRHHQYGRFSILVGIALIILIVALAYKDKLEKQFRLWHLKTRRRKHLKSLRMQNEESQGG